MHKESLMSTPAVSVTVFNPPEEKRSKKAGGGGNTSASDHIGSTFTMIEEETFSPREGLISAIKSLDLAKNQEEVGILRRKIKESYAKTSENYPHEVKFIPKDIKSVLDNYKFGDSSFKALKKLNKTKKAEGSLMVPREGYGVGSLVQKGLERAAKKVYGILRKKDSLIKGGEYEDAIDEIDDNLISLAKESTSEEIDEIFSILKLDAADRLPTDIIDKQNMNLLNPREGDEIVEQAVQDQYPDFYEAYRGEGLFGDSSDPKQTNLSQLERDKKILQEREYYSTFEDETLDDIVIDNKLRRVKKDEGLEPTDFDAEKEKEYYEYLSLRDRDKINTGGMSDEQVGQFVGANEETAPVDTYPNIPPEEMAAAQASQLPDNEMEDTYIDFILDESLNPEEQTYLMNSLEADPQLSVIFDKLIGTASEFSGAGEVEGPGTGVSDSIPARLSDGEFVMTKKATDAIGAENLQMMMDEGERAYDNDGGKAIKMAFGGMIEKDELEDSKNYLSKTDEEIKKVMIGANKMPSVR